MRAWLDVTAGVAGDMLMGALVDAGADVAGIQAAVQRVVGEHVELRHERVLRAGVPATKVHVDIQPSGQAKHTWPQLRERIAGAGLAAATHERALATLHRLAIAYSRRYGLPLDEVALQDVAALDVLADVVGDCEGLRLLDVDEVTASALALGSGHIRTSHGDLPVPVPAVAELAAGWPLAESDARPQPIDSGRPHAFAGATGYMPLGGVDREDGVLTEGPAQVLGGAGELATPTGTALLRTLAVRWEQQPPFEARREGVGAGGRDVPGRPNVVRIQLG